jgi:nucleotide-binding universal stress UspA family protein
MSTRTFLVVVDDSPEFPLAVRYAAQRAMAVGGEVAMLAVVEPDMIETWGGVERALDDHAFDKARALVAQYEALIEEHTKSKPKTFFKKGETRSVLLELIDQEKEISTLVLAAHTRESGRNILIQYLTSDKGIKKLKIPLIVVPDSCRCID